MKTLKKLWIELPVKEGDDYQTMSAEDIERVRTEMRDTVMDRAEPMLAPRFT